MRCVSQPAPVSTSRPISPTTSRSRPTDAAGNTYSEVITLTVNDLIDENPTDITLTGGSVDENAAAGTTVATLSTVDADAGDSHTYAITNDPSGFFEIVGNEVRVAAGATIDFETDQSHDITVETTDAGWQYLFGSHHAYGQ